MPNSIETETEHALFNQWNDALYSGLLKDFEKLTASLIRVHGEEIIKSTEKKVEALRLTTAQKKKLKKQVKDMVMGKLEKIPQTYKSKLKGYLQSSANAGGQDVINSIAEATNKNLPTFKLSNGYYKGMLNARINTLVSSMTSTSRDRLASELMKGFDKKETKQEMIDRLRKAGLANSRYRANMIIKTETAAVREYMRHETARLNGVQLKKWVRAGDKPCDVCSSLAKEVIPIGKSFNNKLTQPPAHPHCECTLAYSIADVLCSNYKKTKKSLKDRIFETFNKEEVAEYESQDMGISCVNPDAVWAGGEGLVGTDKNILTFADALADITKAEIKNAYKAFEEDDLNTMATKVNELEEVPADTNELKRMLSKKHPLHDMNYSDVQYKLIQAKAELTDVGFLQLLKMLGVHYTTPRN